MTRTRGGAAGTDIADGIVERGFWTRISPAEETIHGDREVVCARLFGSWQVVVVVGGVVVVCTIALALAKVPPRLSSDRQIGARARARRRSTSPQAQRTGHEAYLGYVRCDRVFSHEPICLVLLVIHLAVAGYCLLSR